MYFVHTPKCGGKSLRKSLQLAYGEKLLLDYANPLDERWQKKIEHRLTYLKRNVFCRKEYDIVYGHFSFDRYRTGLQKPDAKTAMFFREPIDLICSYYFYTKQKHPDSGIQDIVSFAQGEKYRHLYQTLLGHVPVERLDFVGLMERYEESFALFSRLTGKTIDIQHVNITKSKPKNYHEYLHEQGAYAIVREAMAENIVIYERAKSRFEELRFSDERIS